MRQYDPTNQDQLSGILPIIAEHNIFYKRPHQSGANAIGEAESQAENLAILVWFLCA